MTASFVEHAAVVEAITRGDAQAAALALREHVQVQGERFGDLLASLSELATT
jgi:DNA-binding GntR family transcriptional regulator